MPCPPGFGPIPGVNAVADQPGDPQDMAQKVVQFCVFLGTIFLSVSNNILDKSCYKLNLSLESLFNSVQYLTL